MSTEEKKAFLLLHAIIFYYHGLDEEEDVILRETAAKINGNDELEWAMEFITEDYSTSFERARKYFATTLQEVDNQKKIEYIGKVWTANRSKGFVTEMEASAMIKLARDWGIERDLLEFVRQ